MAYNMHMKYQNFKVTYVGDKIANFEFVSAYLVFKRLFCLRMICQQLNLLLTSRSLGKLWRSGLDDIRPPAR